MLVDVSCLSAGVFTLSKKKLHCSTIFYKVISFTAEAAELRPNNAKQRLNQSNFYSFEQEVSSLPSYFLLTRKKKVILTLLIHNIPHSY